MRNVKIICVQFDFAKKFKCDGSKCNADCCRRWNVHVDAQHRHKMLNIPDGEMQQLIKSRLCYDANRKSHLIVLNEDGCCPFVDVDLLCRIQKNSEELLPDICVTYPRSYQQYRDYMFFDMKYSCPIVAELSLLNNRPLSLEEKEVEIKRPRTISIMDSDFVMDNSLDLRCAAMAILQKRKYSLKERLFILGLFWDCIEERSKEGCRDGSFDDIIAEFLDEKKQAVLLNVLTQISPKQMQFIRDICDLLERIFDNVVSDELFERKPYAGMFLQYFQVAENNTIGAFRRKYEEAYIIYEKYILNKYPYLLENFLVYNIFTLNFPRIVEGSIKQNYAVYLIYYRILEMGLISLAGVKGDALTDKDVSTYLSVVCKRIAHGNLYWKNIKTYVEKYGDDVLKFMQVWLA